jgi:hypothetical protein
VGGGGGGGGAAGGVTMHPAILAEELEVRFRGGTQRYHRLTVGGLVCTDGVRYLAEQAGAYWLLNVIQSYQGQQAVRKAPFQVWRLTVDLEAKTGVVLAYEDSDSANGVPLVRATGSGGWPRFVPGYLVRQELEYTDFPLPEVKVWVIDGVIMLPCEY